MRPLYAGRPLPILDPGAAGEHLAEPSDLSADAIEAALEATPAELWPALLWAAAHAAPAVLRAAVEGRGRPRLRNAVRFVYPRGRPVDRMARAPSREAVCQLGELAAARVVLEASLTGRAALAEITETEPEGGEE